MLKRKVDKATYESLADDIKELYAEKDGEYHLQVEGDDDTGALKRAKDHEVQKRKDAEKKAKELQEQLDNLSGADAKKRGDAEALEKSWKEKYDKREKELLDQIGKKDEFIKTTLVDNVATKLATELCGDKSAIMLPHIKARLAADLEGDAPSTKILDAGGKLSALTVDDLKKEFLANKDFSSIIIGSKASGSGTSKDKQPSVGSASLGADGKPIAFTDMTPAQRVAHLDSLKNAN